MGPENMGPENIDTGGFEAYKKHEREQEHNCMSFRAIHHIHDRHHHAGHHRPHGSALPVVIRKRA
jgi:hypothetical protein